MRLSSTHPFRVAKLPAAISLLGALLAVAPAHSAGPARASAGAPLEVSCEGNSTGDPARVRDPIGLNYTARHLALAHGGQGRVILCVRVDSLGLPRDVKLPASSTPFDSAAVDAVRWWQFDPPSRGGRATSAWLPVAVEVRPPADADPLVPDVLALAVESEARGDANGAIDAWTGALARVGLHPSLQNEWVMREHILRLAAATPNPPGVPGIEAGRARGARGLMQRNIARGANADYARTLDGVLRNTPWYADAYRWRAAARAASGQRAGAIRDVLCYRLGVADSASRALADQALVLLAQGDTLRANSLLKN